MTSTPWVLTTSTHDRHTSIIGEATNPDQAREQLVAATLATINQAGAGLPRYTLHIGRALAAIIQTGADEYGTPDHATAAQLVTQLRHTVNPFTG